MFDTKLRRWVAPSLSGMSARLVRFGVSANSVTLIGLVMALAATLAIIWGHNYLGAALILLNRLCDGLDGAIARRQGATRLGAYLDIVFDFLFYGLIPLSFALQNPAQNALAAAFLLTSFLANGSAFLAMAAFITPANVKQASKDRRPPYNFLSMLAEGTETIFFFSLFCLFPSQFVPLAIGFACLCWISALARITKAVWIIRQEGG